MYGKKMRRIKLFEGFNGGITEQEIRGALVELVDVGYDVLVTKLDSKLANVEFVSSIDVDRFINSWASTPDDQYVVPSPLA